MKINYGYDYCTGNFKTDANIFTITDSQLKPQVITPGSVTVQINYHRSEYEKIVSFSLPLLWMVSLVMPQC